MQTHFLKMHGAGNDFVIFDARKTKLALDADQLAHIANRRTGIGCDQVIVIENAKKADAFMHIYNADASESSACGNATRCVAWMLMRESGKKQVIIETRAGLLDCKSAGDFKISVDMGEPSFHWQDIPLSEERNGEHLGITMGELSDPAALSMGNPHMVFTVDNVDKVPVAEYGPKLEHHKLFPERTNVSFAQVIDRRHVKLRVWERGVGETLACGTAACATLVALHSRDLIDSKADIELPGGTLHIEWDDTVRMTGEVALSFEGTLTL